MKILYLECYMGAAGDMLMAALSELLPEPEKFFQIMNGLGLSQVCVYDEKIKKSGITGTLMHVTIGGTEEEEHRAGHDIHKHEHHTHNHYRQIEHLIMHLPLSEQVRRNAAAVYRMLGEAEAAVHDTELEQIHFHEVGTYDAVADIVGVCLLMEMIGADRILASPVNTGRGQVRCAHGVLPVPAPATAKILEGVPTYAGDIESELCTPTGAALLKYFVSEFIDRPLMKICETGYGFGKKEFEVLNCVRAFLGDSMERGANHKIAQLACNVDDMTGEAIGFAAEILFEQGALDVFTIPIQMKKSRPGQMFVCLCEVQDSEKMAKLFLKHTTSFGVRQSIVDRYQMLPSFEREETCYGSVRVKKGSGYGMTKEKAEYEDISACAKKNGVSLDAVLKALFDK